MVDPGTAEREAAEVSAALSISARCHAAACRMASLRLWLESLERVSRTFWPEDFGTEEWGEYVLRLEAMDRVMAPYAPEVNMLKAINTPGHLAEVMLTRAESFAETPVHRGAAVLTLNLRKPMFYAEAARLAAVALLDGAAVHAGNAPRRYGSFLPPRWWLAPPYERRGMQ